MQSEVMSRGKVLIVDDAEPVGRLCETYLAQNGYLPVYIASPQEALTRMEQEAFDLLVSDLAMPETDGIQFVQAAQSRQVELPVIVVTAHRVADCVIQSLEAGVSAFLSKPFTEEELLQVVEDVLERSQLTRENLRMKLLLPLYEVSEQFILEPHPSALFARIVEMAVLETHSDLAVLMLKEEATSRLSVEAVHPSVFSQGTFRDQEQTTFLNAVLEVGYATLEASEALIRRNQSEVRTHHPQLSQAYNTQIVSLLSVPLLYRGACQGILGLFRLQEENAYNEGDLGLAHILAGHLVLAIENVRLFSDLEQPYLETMKCLSQRLESKEPHTKGDPV